MSKEYSRREVLLGTAVLAASTALPLSATIPMPDKEALFFIDRWGREWPQSPRIPRKLQAELYRLAGIPPKPMTEADKWLEREEGWIDTALRRSAEAKAEYARANGLPDPYDWTAEQHAEWFYAGNAGKTSANVAVPRRTTGSSAAGTDAAAHGNSFPPCEAVPTMRLQKASKAPVMATGARIDGNGEATMPGRIMIENAPFGPADLGVARQAFDGAWEDIAARYADGAVEAARERLAKLVLSLMPDTSDPAEIQAIAVQEMTKG